MDFKLGINTFGGCKEVSEVLQRIKESEGDPEAF
jgi:hypothetical protein